MQLQRISDGQPVRLAMGPLLGAGGEARIHAVADHPGLAAKIYHRPTSDHAAKLQAMLANRPEDPMAGQGHVSIAWPSDLLIDADGSKRVVGFLMPRVVGMHPIIDFYHPKTRRRKHPLFSYRYLLRTARNLASCVSALHQRGYVIGDLNESNILVGETALVTLVDTDSFQVTDAPNNRVHRCRVGKPEFTPPELQSVRFEWVDRKPEHDLFGLAVLFFQLLMEGIHPFAGRHLGRGEPPSLEQRISAGWFPYAVDDKPAALPMPTAPPIAILNAQLLQLFMSAFVHSRSRPAGRPDAQAWQRALLAAEESLIACPANLQHQYGNHLNTCPWCERKALLHGVDSFPSEQDLRTARTGRLLLRTRGPKRVAVVDQTTAIKLAVRTMVRRRRERNTVIALLLVIMTGLVIYWCWAISMTLRR